MAECHHLLFSFLLPSVVDHERKTTRTGVRLSARCVGRAPTDQLGTWLSALPTAASPRPCLGPGHARPRPCPAPDGSYFVGWTSTVMSPDFVTFVGKDRNSSASRSYSSSVHQSRYTAALISQATNQSFLPPEHKPRSQTIPCEGCCPGDPGRWALLGHRSTHREAESVRLS